MTPVLAVAPSAWWYLTRAGGAVSLLLLTATVVLGVVEVSRWSSERWPRFVLDGLHRNVSLLALMTLSIHIVSAVLDSFAPVRITDVVVPFVSAYRPLWLGLGALAFDILLAVTLTSLARMRLGHKTWRAVHWAAYACWPLALLHGLGTGTDTRSFWMLALSTACLTAVVIAAGWRTREGWPSHWGGESSRQPCSCWALRRCWFGSLQGPWPRVGRVEREPPRRFWPPLSPPESRPRHRACAFR